MQVKIPNDSTMDEGPTSSNHQKFDKTCTSSVYISQPSSSACTSVSNDHVMIESSNSNSQTAQANRNVGDVEQKQQLQHQKPVLTIQVNQNNPTVMNQSSSNLVNIVSCFRAYPTSTVIASHNTIDSGNENLVQNSNNNNVAPFSVSVNRNNCDNIGKSSSSDESVNNENNQNIINIEASLKNNNFTENEAQSNSTVKREVDLNEICVDNSSDDKTNASSCNSNNNNSNVDYNTKKSSTTLEIIANQNHVGLKSNEIEKMTVIGTNEGTGEANHADNVINHTTIEMSGEVESKENHLRNDNCTKSETQSHRDQRRRERRERRQARQRAQLQHGHHHITPVHHQRANTASTSNGIRTLNGVEPLRTTSSNFEILPDIVNHQPPAYTTLPLQLPPSPTIHTISPVPVPVVVDDCRFSFPIPIIRR